MSARYSNVTNTEVEYSFWLVFDHDGGMRLARAEPNLLRGERGMKCSAILPRSLFRTPELKANIRLGEQPPDAYKIDIEAAGEALRNVIGVDIDLRVQEPGNG